MKHKYAQKPNFNILARFDLQHTLFINKKANIRLLITKDYKIYKSPPGCKNQKFNFQGLKIMKLTILDS